jgi:hypothetical protein
MLCQKMRYLRFGGWGTVVDAAALVWKYKRIRQMVGSEEVDMVEVLADSRLNGIAE